MRRVVVTGLGIVSSIGNSQDEVVQSLKTAKSGIVRAEKYAELGFRCQVHGDIDLDWQGKVARKPRRFMESGVGWNYIAMEQAIADAQLDDSHIINPRTGIIMGSGGPSTYAIVKAAETTLTKGPKKIGPFEVPKAMCSGPSAALATAFQIKGTNYSISSACSTSAHCIGNAAELIQFGKQDIMFAGGCEELEWTLSNLFDAMGAMSSGFNDTPERASRAFDKDRDGFVIAGGAGVLVLEELEHAKARGATIYCEIAGYGASSDGYDMVAPSGEGAKRCMEIAMRGMDGTGLGCEIDYINPHATATPVGDQKEVQALRELFGNRIPKISATKSLTGHSLGAIGVQEAVFSILMMKHRFICKSANIDELDPEFEGIPVVMERLDDVDLNCVMSNSFGFGGTNATLILRRLDG